MATSSTQTRDTDTLKAVGKLEEGDVDQAGALLQRAEDDPFAGRDGRRLRGGPHSGDENLVPGHHGAQVGGVGRAELAQQPVVVLHQMLAHVGGEGVEFGAEPVAAGHVRQPARSGGHQFAAQRQLPVGGRAVAGLSVQFGGLQEQIPAGQAGGEGADTDQALGERRGRAGAQPQILQAGVGLAGHQAGGLRLGDARDRGERQAYPQPCPLRSTLCCPREWSTSTGSTATPWRRASATMTRRGC